MDIPESREIDSKCKFGQAGLRELYDRISEAQYDFRNANLYNLIVNYLKGSNLLDVGCGPGNFLFLAQKYGYEVSGIEPDSELIALGNRLYPGFNLNVQCGPVENLIMNQPVDNITMIDVLEHIKDDEKVLSYLSKNLTKTGQLILVVPAHPSLYGIRDQSIGHYRRYSKKQIVYLVESSGMKILKSRYWNALGVVPFFISEKIMHKPLQANLRGDSEQKGLKKLFAKGLYFWFKFIENAFDFRFGLSLVVVAEVKNKHF